jgi:hypothetical protein
VEGVIGYFCLGRIPTKQSRLGSWCHVRVYGREERERECVCVCVCVCVCMNDKAPCGCCESIRFD